LDEKFIVKTIYLVKHKEIELEKRIGKEKWKIGICFPP
jgi:hypothetical protein